MISIVRSFGAPVIEPPGKHGADAVGRLDVRRAAGRARSRRAGARSRRSRRASAFGTCTVPTSQTTPRSLRSRSTIIRFSARFFSSARSSLGAGARPRPASRRAGAVPLIGFASTQPSRPTRRKRSGEELSTAHVAEAQEGRERRRVDAAQRAVERERVGDAVGGDLVGQADLVASRLRSAAAGTRRCRRGSARASGRARSATGRRPARVRPGALERRRATPAARRSSAIQRSACVGAAGLGDAEQVGAAARRGRRRSAGRRTRTRRRAAASACARVAAAVGLQLVAEVADEAAGEVERQVVRRASRSRRMLAAEVVEDRSRSSELGLAVGALDPQLAAGDVVVTIARRADRRSAPMNEKRARRRPALLSSQNACSSLAVERRRRPRSGSYERVEPLDLERELGADCDRTAAARPAPPAPCRRRGGGAASARGRAGASGRGSCASSWRPCSVQIDSGWNWTPHSGRVRCATAISTPSLVQAIGSSSSGSGCSTHSEW